MTTPQLKRLSASCQRLRLHRVDAELSALLEQAAKKDVSYADFLDDVLTRELAAKQEKHQAMRVMMARFPFQKTLESFDWKFQPSIEPKIIKELATGRFIADSENVLLLGPPGVGKTHLAVVLGMSACALGLRMMFTTATGLITTLGKALYENRLEERLKVLTQPKLLIIDEIGYIPRIGRARICSSNSFHAAMNGARSSSRAIRAWGRGAKCSVTPSSPVRSSIGCCTTRRRSTSRAIRIG